MKIIDFKRIKNIKNLNNYKLLYQWVDYALKNKELFVMPNKTRLSQDNGNYFAIMPCLYEKEDLAFVKMIGRHTLINEMDNRSVMMSDILLYNSKTGILKAVLDGEYITTIRTGVVAAHSALLFSKSNYFEIGLIGLGNIMYAFLRCFLANYDNRPLKIKLYKHNKQELRLIKSFANFANISFEIYDDYDSVIRNSDIIVSAVTRIDHDFCNDDVYKPGCTVIPICTLGFQNCDLFFDKIFTDEIEQIRDFKYFNYFKSVSNTSDVLKGEKIGRSDDQERILVYNYGLAIHDLYFASKIYELVDDCNVDYNYCKEKFFME